MLTVSPSVTSDPVGGGVTVEGRHQVGVGGAGGLLEGVRELGRLHDLGHDGCRARLDRAPEAAGEVAQQPLDEVRGRHLVDGTGDPGRDRGVDGLGDLGGHLLLDQRLHLRRRRDRGHPGDEGVGVGHGAGRPGRDDRDGHEQGGQDEQHDAADPARSRGHAGSLPSGWSSWGRGVADGAGGAGGRHGIRGLRRLVVRARPRGHPRPGRRWGRRGPRPAPRSAGSARSAACRSRASP